MSVCELSHTCAILDQLNSQLTASLANAGEIGESGESPESDPSSPEFNESNAMIPAQPSNARYNQSSTPDCLPQGP